MNLLLKKVNLQRYLTFFLYPSCWRYCRFCSLKSDRFLQLLRCFCVNKSISQFIENPQSKVFSFIPSSGKFKGCRGESGMCSLNHLSMCPLNHLSMCPLNYLYMCLKSPLHVSLKSPIHVSLKSPLHVSFKSFLHVSLKSPLHVSLKSIFAQVHHYVKWREED